MKKSVRKRKRISGISIQKSGSGFVLTKKQFWTWGIGISVLLILLALSVDYFSNTVSYSYNNDDLGNNAGELYATKGKGERCGLIDNSGDFQGCGDCLTCNKMNAEIWLITNTQTCPPCILLEKSKEFQDFKRKYSVKVYDLSKPENVLFGVCYTQRTPTMFVVDNTHKDRDCSYQGKIYKVSNVICQPVIPTLSPIDNSYSKSLEPLIKCLKDSQANGVCESDPKQEGQKCTPDGWVGTGSSEYVCKKGDCAPK